MFAHCIYHTIHYAHSRFYDQDHVLSSPDWIIYIFIYFFHFFLFRFRSVIGGSGSSSGAEHHVHFDQATLRDDDFESDNNCVTYQQAGDNIVVVHLGFLQINHRYLIELSLPSDLFKCNTSVPINLVADNSSVPSIHCKLADKISLVNVEANGVDQQRAHGDSPANDKCIQHYVINVEYFAYREKLLREELKLINANNSVELLKLVITARVLGKGKGTPMLRNGVHCIGAEADDESEMSEDPTATHRTTNRLGDTAAASQPKWMRVHVPTTAHLRLRTT